MSSASSWDIQDLGWESGSRYDTFRLPSMHDFGMVGSVQFFFLMSFLTSVVLVQMATMAVVNIL